VDARKLDRSELIGMVAAVVLVISLFLVWFSLTTDPDVVQRAQEDPNDWACGVGDDSCSGWDTFPIMRFLLIAAASAPFILAWIVVRGHALSWPRGELTAIVGLTAFVLIAYNGIIDKPGSGTEEIGLGLAFGYWLGLLGAIGIAATGFLRSQEGQRRVRKAPGTV